MLKNKLNELNIFALRDFARKTGVSSPTSKKKDQLIKEILEIVSGEKQPVTTKTKQGRPPKTFGYNFANVFNADVFGDDLLNQTLKQDEVDFSNGNGIVTVAGWIELINNNSALLWVNKNFRNENYFVPSDLIAGLDVRPGDRVVAEVGFDDNVRIVKKIFNINSYPVLQMPQERVEFLNIAHKIQERYLEFDNAEYSNLKIKHGENVYLYGTNNNFNTIEVVKMLNSLKVENKLYVNISVAEKNKIFLSEIKDAEMFTAYLTDEESMAKRVVGLAIERAKRIMENGEDVVIAVDDISSVLGMEKSGLELVKNLVSIAKESDKNGSITLIAVIPNFNVNVIEKLADKRLIVSENQIAIL